MGKWGRYEKHYNPDWEKQAWAKEWLMKTPEQEVNNGKGEAYCKLCRTYLRAHKTDLIKHKGATSHTNREKQLQSNLKAQNQPTLQTFGIEAVGSERKIIDLKLAVHIACHSSIRSIDHLGQLLSDVGKGSKLEHLQHHRTKCSKLIANVIAPSMLKETVDDIGCAPYSIIIDESTDISVHKYMAFCVRYFSKKQNSVQTDFLGLVEVTKTTAEDLYEAFTSYIASIGLSITRLVGIGTDGASNLCGVNRSLFTLLRDRDVPRLVLIKCVCHSMDRCARKACEQMPSSLEFLIRESRSWFSHSSLRKEQYAGIYQTLNCGKDPPCLIQLSGTRWLAWHGAVKTTLEQWDSLKLHFELMATNEKCYTARTLAAMYNDPANRLYLVFLRPVLREITGMNMAFQGTNADVTKVYSDLRTLLLSLAARLVRPEALKESRPGVLRNSELNMVREALSRESALLPVDRVKFGDAFSTECQSSRLPPEELLAVKRRCADFLLTLTRELVARLPNNIQSVEKMRCFSVHLALAKSGRPNSCDLPLEHADDADRELIEIQWGSLGVLNLNDIFPGEEDYPEITRFWIAVHNLRTAGGQYAYRELATFVLRLLSLPVSNAIVERVFSVMNATKTKPRNKLTMNMLQAIMRTRIHLQARGQCCDTFTPTPHMLSLFTSKMYDTLNNDNINNNQQEGAVGVDEDDFDLDLDAFVQNDEL